MTFKDLIRGLSRVRASERRRLVDAKRYNTARRLEGRIAGLGIAIRMAERMRQQKLAQAAT